MILLSIKPEWAEKIYTGKKTIEIRKRFFNDIDYAYLYETSPKKSITGIVRFGDIYSLSYNDFYNTDRYNFILENAGVTTADIKEYARCNEKKLNFLLVSKHLKFTQPLIIANNAIMKIFTSPQTYRNFKPDELKFIIQLLEDNGLRKSIYHKDACQAEMVTCNECLNG